MAELYGALEGGGTKFVCAAGTGPEDVRDEVRFATTAPDETLEQAAAFFRRHAVSALGLACFGPLDLNPASPDFGSITATPKAGWAGTNLLRWFREHFDLPVALDTDVNAAAIGEYTWPAESRGIESLVYFTIGTGIGAGLVLNGRIVHGLTHPEAGHFHLPHDWKADPYPGNCRFHGDCFEGLACGPAITARWGQPADSLPDDHPAWELEAGYIASALTAVITLVSPQRIVLGGGVMERHQLFPMIRSRVRALLNGYVASPVIAGSLEDYIVPPALGRRSAILGAMAMAKALDAEERGETRKG
jgi:fructokinase